MTEENYGPMTDDEARQFAEKLSGLSSGLSSKERWFLSEALARGVQSGRVENEVSGYGGLLGNNVFFPNGMGAQFGVTTSSPSTPPIAGYMKIDAPSR